MTTPVDGIMRSLGVRTPKEHEQLLRKMSLPPQEIVSRMKRFRRRWRDMEHYCDQTISDSIEKHRSAPSEMMGGGSLASAIPAQDYLDEELYLQDFDDRERKAMINQCLADGLVLDRQYANNDHIVLLEQECVDYYRARKFEWREYHRKVLQEAAKCIDANGEITGDELTTCVETGIVEAKLLFV